MPSRVLLALLLHVGAAAALASRAVNMARFEEMLSACVLPPAAIEVIDDPCAHTPRIQPKAGEHTHLEYNQRPETPLSGATPCCRQHDACIASRVRRKMRTLFRGVSAAAEQPAVRNAFSIVYQDLGPIRVAGDLIFNKLKRIASEADTRIAGLEALQSADTNALTAARTLFDVVDEDASGGLTRSELLASPVLLELLRSGRRKVRASGPSADHGHGATAHASREPRLASRRISGARRHSTTRSLSTSSCRRLTSTAMARSPSSSSPSRPPRAPAGCASPTRR